MSRYRMDDGTVVDTSNATQSWDEDTRWDGSNNISVATGGQWCHQTLYRSRKGRYYVEHTSQWQGSVPHVEWVSPQDATRWLLTQAVSPADTGWPADLTPYVDEIVE